MAIQRVLLSGVIDKKESTVKDMEGKGAWQGSREGLHSLGIATSRVRIMIRWGRGLTLECLV